MVKKVALKGSKELLLETAAKQQGLSSNEFVQNWRGRVIILNAEESAVAEKMGFDKNGEYAIKVN